MLNPTIDGNDPFNCPDCGSHDYGLYIVPFGECVWCLKKERDRYKAAWDAAYTQAMENGQAALALKDKHGR